jgi:uncharacterized alkaline shock family protein YloU
MTAVVAETRPLPLAGRAELGRITIADRVVTKIAAMAAAENPDAGASGTGMLRRGPRTANLGALPKTSVYLDGTKAYVSVELAVRWSASVTDVTAQVRRHIRDRVLELAGVQVDEVDIIVASLATDITPPPRVR